MHRQLPQLTSRSVALLSIAVTALIASTGCDKPPTTSPAVAIQASAPIQAAKRRDMECPVAPKQSEKDLEIDAKGKIEGLASLAGATLEGKVKTITQDLLSKYPNTDKLYLSQLIISTACQLIRSSPDLSDKEAFDRLDSINTQITKLLLSTAPPTPDLLARARFADFGKFPSGFPQLIKMSKATKTTLHIFEPDCDVFVFISDILETSNDHHVYTIVVPDERLTAKSFENFSHVFSYDEPVMRRGLLTTVVVSNGSELAKATDADYSSLANLMESGEFYARLVISPTKNGCPGAAYYIEYSASAEHSTYA